MTTDLDDYVKKIDALGGPDAPSAQDYMASFTYEPRTFVDQGADPLSERYIRQQTDLYGELSGRSVNQESNEITFFNLPDHLHTPNPYGPGWSPPKISLHYARLSKAIRNTDIAYGAAVLDMGCGWGLTTEFLATVGCVVTGVDINQSFVELVKVRNIDNNLKISAEWGNFDQYDTDELYDAILFYECFHHAISPWELLKRARNWLKPGGKIILAGEPIQEIWWKYWGLRLDSLSVYCIRKFGWFESGWSAPFLKRMFDEAGFDMRIIPDADGEIGNTVIATKMPSNFSEISDGPLLTDSGWIHEGGAYISTGEANLTFRTPPQRARANFVIGNYRGKSIDLRVKLGNGSASDFVLDPGLNKVSLVCPAGMNRVGFSSTKWSPAAELGGIDDRTLSFHLLDVGFS